MRPRKTTSVEDLIDTANHMLEHSTCSREARCGMIALLESMLHATGNYRGFSYLNGWPCKDSTRVKYHKR
jgi:hypothetical protein